MSCICFVWVVCVCVLVVSVCFAVYFVFVVVMFCLASCCVLVLLVLFRFFSIPYHPVAPRTTAPSVWIRFGTILCQSRSLLTGVCLLPFICSRGTFCLFSSFSFLFRTTPYHGTVRLDPLRNHTVSVPFIFNRRVPIPAHSKS